MWTECITIGTSSGFGLKLVFVDNSIVLVSRILDLSIYQHIIILFDHIPLKRIIAHVSNTADLTIG